MPSAHTIVFTGGGTAGHVVPNLALITEFERLTWQVAYIGSYTGIEKRLVEQAGVDYFAIASGKLRRYFSWQNFIDPLHILRGILQAYWRLGRLRASVVFSKGGFVAFPVVVAAWLRRIPVIAHESDMTPGLANRLSYPFVKQICLGFAAAKKSFPNQQKVVVTGTPLRQQLFHGNKQQGLTIAGLTEAKPVLLVLAGGSGSKKINAVVRDALPTLLKKYQVIHLCGKDNVDASLQQPGYAQFDYVSDGLEHLFACAECVISRSGANALYELLALKKPHILIPLGRQASRGDQIQNANYYRQLGTSEVINEEDLSADVLTRTIADVFARREAFISKMAELALPDSVTLIVQAIQTLATYP